MRAFAILAAAMAFPVTVSSLSASMKTTRVAVFGGTGYVGSAVCERLIKKGYAVTAVSRRGINPRPESPELSQVNWIIGDATDVKTVNAIVKDSDAAVHAIGLLFDVDSGLSNLNKIVSGSGSIPGELSTYDAITRGTMFNICNAIDSKMSKNIFGSKRRYPLMFVSAAEAGWPEVRFGDTVEKLAPAWLNKYLGAKRAVEERVQTSANIRAGLFRPSLIWDWTKYDVLPAIPLFNIASAIGVPFVDKTVRVETLADAIVAGIGNDDVEGVQRYMQMEALSKEE